MAFRFLTQIKQLPLFAHRSEEDIFALLKNAEEKTLKHRQVLYQAGDVARSFAVVVNGAFKLAKSTSTGHDVIVFFATPGDVIGGLIMGKQDCTYPISAISMGTSLVLKIPRETFLNKWASDSDMFGGLTGMLSGRMGMMHDYKALAKAPLQQKVATLIVSLIERYSGQAETVLPIPLTRQEIADAVGASVESVIRVMSDWSQNGIIETNDQVIQILRMDRILEVMKGPAA